MSKNIYFSNNTKRMINAVFPSDKKISNDETSNGYKFINLLYGIEIDSIYDYLDDARHHNSIELFDYGTDYDYYETIIKDNIVGDVVYGDNIPIKITTYSEFNDGIPTRMDYIKQTPISGVNYGALGLEYVRKNVQGSGILLLNTDVNASNIYPSYQTLIIPIDSVGVMQTTPESGYNFLVKNKSYDSAGRDEILIPPTYRELKQKYPLTRKIMAPSGINKWNYEYEIDHYTPNNGYVWNDELQTYLAKSFPEEYYLDDDNNKVYYRTYLNNPYGKDSYDTTYIPLEYIPIRDTLKLFDLDILESGEMREIASSGAWLYTHSGYYDTGIEGEQQKWFSHYKGYESTVPHEFLPEPAKDQTLEPWNPTGIISADPYQLVSWDYQHEGAGLTDELVWEDNPSGEITNILKITNGQSRYIAEYKYTYAKKANYITTTDSTKYIKQANGRYTMSLVDNDDNLVEIEANLSKDKNERYGIVFDGLTVRPDSNVDEIYITYDSRTIPEPLNSSNINVYAGRPKIGSRYQTIKPLITDRRIYMMNQYFGDASMSGVLSTHKASGDILERTVYDNYDGLSITKLDTSEHSYFETIGTYSGFMQIKTSPETRNNRFLKMNFKLTEPISKTGEQILAVSCTSSGWFWMFDITENGSYRVRDNFSTLVSYDKIIQEGDNISREIILERNTDYDYSTSNTPYYLYVKETNDTEKIIDRSSNIFKRYDFSVGPNTTDASGIIDIGDYTRFFYDCSVDVKYVQIYEEQRDLIDD